jgi:SAM-dependent methyltransferase
MALAQRAADATGIDATAALLNIARSEANVLGLENIEFLEGTALSLPFERQSFDLVSCRAAFHHFEEPEKVLREMARVTRVGGELLIADILGNSDMDKARHHDALEKLCDPTHVSCLSAEAFRSMFAQEGLEISKEIKGKTTYDVPGWIEHGGPNPETAAEIARIFEDNNSEDRIGLEPRQENGVMMFTHQTVVYVLEKVTG